MVTTRSQADTANQTVKGDESHQDPITITPSKSTKKKQVQISSEKKENKKTSKIRKQVVGKESKVTNPKMVTPLKKRKQESSISYPIKLNEYTPSSVVSQWNKYIKIAMIGKWYQNSPEDKMFVLASTDSEIQQEMEVIQDQMAFDNTSITISREEEDKARIKENEKDSNAHSDQDSQLESLTDSDISQSYGKNEDKEGKSSPSGEEEQQDVDDGSTEIDEDSILSDFTNSSDVTQTILCHSLSQVTRDSTISRWPVRALVNIINKRNKEFQMYLPFEHLQQMDPAILRRIVRDTRDDMVQKNSTNAYVSEVPVHEGTFNEITPDWELEAYEIEDLKLILWKYMEVTKTPYPTSINQMNKDEILALLLEKKNKMNLNQLPWTNVHSHLSFFEGNVEKEVAKFKYKQELSQTQVNFLLSGETEDRRIQMWSPFFLKQIIVIWQAKQKLKLNILTIEKLTAQMLRCIVLSIRDEIKEKNNSEVLHVETEFCETINPHSKKWEIDSFSLQEQKTLLLLLSGKMDKSYEIDDMTNEEINSCIMDLLSTDLVRERSITVDHFFSAATKVTQATLNAYFSTKKKQKKIIHLSKVTSKASIVEWSPKVMVEMILKKHPKMTAKEKFQLIKEPTPTLRKRVFDILSDLQVGQKSDIYKSEDERTGFFGYLTMDWEIKGLSNWETFDLIKQTRKFFQITVSPGEDHDTSSLHKELIRFRDSLKDESNTTFFNLTSLTNPKVKKKKTGKTKHNNRETDLREKASQIKLGAYVNYNKEQMIQKFRDHYQDICPGEIVENIDCIPVLTRTTEDIILGSWPPKNRIEILQQAGLNCEGQDCMELLQSLKNLRNSLSPSKEVKALTPYYGFFTRNTKDSELWSKSTFDLKMIYMLYCGRFGIVLTIQLLESVGKQDLVEELQMIRSLIVQKIDYRFDLCIAAVQRGDLSLEDPIVKEMHIQIARRIRAFEVRRNVTFEKSIRTPENETDQEDEDPDMEDDGEEHIMGLTADWEINNLSLEEAKSEIKYQYKLMSKKPIKGSILSKFSRDKLLEKLFSIRDMHKRIYNAFNLQPEEECHQDDMLSEESVATNSIVKPSKEENMESDVEDMETENQSTDNDDQDSTITMHSTEANLITQDEVSEDDEDDKEMQDASEEDSTATPSEESSEDEEEMSDEENSFHEVKSKSRKKSETKKKSKNSKDDNMNDFQFDTRPASGTSPTVEYCYLRAKLEVPTRSPHVAKFLKKLVCVLRTHDDSFQILPFDTSKPLTSDTIIVHEDQFPDTTAYLADWVRGIMVNRSQKLCFSLRIITKKQFKDIKSDIHEIIDSEGWFINFDQVEAPTVYLLGWLKGIHPRLHNRDLIKKFIEQRLPYTKNKLHLYYRTLWENDEKGESIGTEGIAIDGASRNREKMFDDIANLPWNIEYGDVVFVPMKCSRDFTLAHKVSAYEQQNTYINHTRSRSIQLADNPILSVVRGRNIYFQDWIIQQTVDNKRFLQKAEMYRNNSVRLIYQKDFDHIVEEVIVNLYSNIERSFSKGTANRLLGSAAKQFEKLATYNKKTEYNKKCAKLIEESKTIVRRVEGKATSIHPRQKTQVRSYAAAATGQSTTIIQQAPIVQQPQIQSKQVEGKVRELEALVQQNRFDEQKLTARLQDEFKKELTKTKEGLEKKMRKDKHDTMDAIQKSAKNMEKKLETKEQNFTAQLQSITSMIIETKEENVVQSSAVERIEKNQNRLLSAIEALNPARIQPTPPIRAVERGSCHGVVR